MQEKNWGASFLLLVYIIAVSYFMASVDAPVVHMPAQYALPTLSKGSDSPILLHTTQSTHGLQLMHHADALGKLLLSGGWLTTVPLESFFQAVFLQYCFFSQFLLITFRGAEIFYPFHHFW